MMEAKTYTLEEQKANRKLWVEALRSGKYEQGKNGLLSRGGQMCCLGVLCAVAGMVSTSHDSDWCWFGDQWVIAPDVAREFVGLTSSNGEWGIGDNCLSGANDGGKTFAEIADIIESEPPGLFVESSHV